MFQNKIFLKQFCESDEKAFESVEKYFVETLLGGVKETDNSLLLKTLGSKHSKKLNFQSLNSLLKNSDVFATAYMSNDDVNFDAILNNFDYLGNTSKNLLMHKKNLPLELKINFLETEDGFFKTNLGEPFSFDAELENALKKKFLTEAEIKVNSLSKELVSFIALNEGLVLKMNLQNFSSEIITFLYEKVVSEEDKVFIFNFMIEEIKLNRKQLLPSEIKIGSVPTSAGSWVNYNTISQTNPSTSNPSTSSASSTKNVNVNGFWANGNLSMTSYIKNILAYSYLILFSKASIFSFKEEIIEILKNVTTDPALAQYENVNSFFSECNFLITSFEKGETFETFLLAETENVLKETNSEIIFEKYESFKKYFDINFTYTYFSFEEMSVLLTSFLINENTSLEVKIEIIHTYFQVITENFFENWSPENELDEQLKALLYFKIISKKTFSVKDEVNLIQKLTFMAFEESYIHPSLKKETFFKTSNSLTHSSFKAKVSALPSEDIEKLHFKYLNLIELLFPLLTKAFKETSSWEVFLSVKDTFSGTLKDLIQLCEEV